MKFTIHRTKKDCIIPRATMAVAGLKKESELQLEVENGVIILLRPEMNAKQLFSVSEFLNDLATRMAVAVAMECDDCCGCGDCLEDDEDCECNYCDSHEECHGISLPDCLLEQAGIGKDQPWQAETEDGVVTIRALLEDEENEDDIFPDEVPEAVRLMFIENNICIPHLRELLCSGDPIEY